MLAALDKTGMAGNTLVIFTSDNGCSPVAGVPALERQGHFPSELRRGYKADIWDGGHRIPFIARWPGQIAPGSSSDQLICLTDLMATCADILGAKLPDNAGEDSVSILPVLLGKADQAVARGRRPSFHQRLLRDPPGAMEARTLRQFRGLERTEARQQGSEAASAGPTLRHDQGRRRTHNESKAHPEIVARLTKLLEKYIADGRSTPGPPQKNDTPSSSGRKGIPTTKHFARPGTEFKTHQCGMRGGTIVEFDWTVGQVLGTLDRLKLAENTLVILTSDNGGILEGMHVVSPRLGSQSSGTSARRRGFLPENVAQASQLPTDVGVPLSFAST